MMLGISMIAASETLNLGAKLGMDPKLLSNIINTSTGRCWSTDSYNPVPGVMPNVPSSRGYTGGFGNSLIAKDLGLAVDAAHVSKSTVFLGSFAHQLYNHLSSLPDYEKKDFSSVYDFLSQKTSEMDKKKN
jgi:3-hydroxyisobutyrate dehydrogenase